MPSLNEILQLLFGGEITAEAVANIVVVIYAIVMSFISKRATTRAITADRNASAAETEVASLKTEVTELKQAVGFLGDIISTAFLSSESVNINIRKELSATADKIASVAHVPLSDRTKSIIEAVKTFEPAQTIVKKKEAAAALIKETSDIITKAKEDAKDLISKIQI
jgi:hypothetical protein